LPIAYNYLKKRQLHTLAADVAEGTGADIPALFGLASLQRICVISVLEEGDGDLIFPGEAQCKVRGGQGAGVLWLETSIIGHLAIPFSEFLGAESTACQVPDAPEASCFSILSKADEAGAGQYQMTETRIVRFTQLVHANWSTGILLLDLASHIDPHADRDRKELANFKEDLVAQVDAAVGPSLRGPNSVAREDNYSDSGQSSVNLRVAYLMTESDQVVEDIDMDQARSFAAARFVGR
ncbi:unnamed protein product, partial [Prorocentrum cordatum]